MSTLRLANIGDIELILGDADLKPGDRIEIRGMVDVIRGNLVEITALGMTEPQLVTGERTATICVTTVAVLPPPVHHIEEDEAA